VFTKYLRTRVLYKLASTATVLPRRYTFGLAKFNANSAQRARKLQQRRLNFAIRKLTSQYTLRIAFNRAARLRRTIRRHVKSCLVSRPRHNTNFVGSRKANFTQNRYLPHSYRRFLYANAQNARIHALAAPQKLPTLLESTRPINTKKAFHNDFYYDRESLTKLIAARIQTRDTKNFMLSLGYRRLSVKPKHKG
jgi:hypothetical protein